MALKDRKLEGLVRAEIKRQEETLDLIASENLVSAEVLKILGSPLTNKYSEGYPGRRYYPGNFYYDEIEKLAEERALKLFSLSPKQWQVNVQPYSGAPANFAVYAALVPRGGKIMGMKLAAGGHLTHGHKVSLTGQFWQSVQYGVNSRGLIDYKEVEKLAKKFKPDLIVSGFTAYPRKVNFKKFGEIARSVGAYHLADISHIAGLVVGRVHPAPFAWADVVTTTTHKTLRGPRGAVIFSRKELSPLIDRAVFPGLQGGPHNNVTGAMALAFFEASQPEFKKYARQIVKNAKALAGSLKKLGVKLSTGGTETHLILVDARSLGLDGMTAEKKLEEAGIIANRNSLPEDSSPFRPSGIRLGTPALTSRGMREKEMEEVAGLIFGVLTGEANIRSKVKALCKKFPAKSLLGV